MIRFILVHGRIYMAVQTVTCGVLIMKLMKVREIKTTSKSMTMEERLQGIRNICLSCPYPQPRCGGWGGCEHYKQKARELRVGKV